MTNSSFFKQQRILVTGGAGFIGSHLAERLVGEGAHVTVLDNLQAGKWANLEAVASQVTIVLGDVRNSAEIVRLVREVQPHYVFHLAANASVPGSVEDPGYDFETNCGGTFTLLEALRQNGRRECKKFVLASSGAVYGEPAKFPIDETDPLLPISPYGASKVAAETETRMFSRVYHLPVVIARLFNTYGPRMARFVILDFLRKLSRDPMVLEVLGTGQQIRDFTFVSDAVDGLLTLAAYGQVGKAYNLSSGVSYSITELAQEILDVLGLTGQTQIYYTGRSWVGDAQHWEVSIQKIAGLGYDPQVSLSRGLELVCTWFDPLAEKAGEAKAE